MCLAASKAAADAEKSHQYSFSFQDNEVASCREAYADAEGILLHLQNVDTPLKAVLDGPAELERLEVHGPPEECAKLADALGPLGCVFYKTEWGFRNAIEEARAPLTLEDSVVTVCPCESASPAL